MAFDLNEKLVIGLSSSALFDLSESDTIFRTKGESAYRQFQRDTQHVPLTPGIAFPFIQRLLTLNKLDPASPPVEVILLSKNDPDTGLRVMDSIEHHQLDITRAVFLEGNSPHVYIPAFNIKLFLSADLNNVKAAIAAGHPAGHVVGGNMQDMAEDGQLRIAFDFDGVLADDEAETVYKEHDLFHFHQHEKLKSHIPLQAGPLKALLDKLSAIQKLEALHVEQDSNYQPILRVSIITARSAPAHKRVIETLRHWGITVNEAFFMGGIEKGRVLKIMQPHIFFDDQLAHIEPNIRYSPSVHIPFGIANRAASTIATPLVSDKPETNVRMPSNNPPKD